MLDPAASPSPTPIPQLDGPEAQTETSDRQIHRSEIIGAIVQQLQDDYRDTSTQDLQQIFWKVQHRHDQTPTMDAEEQQAKVRVNTLSLAVLSHV